MTESAKTVCTLFSHRQGCKIGIVFHLVFYRDFNLMTWKVGITTYIKGGGIRYVVFFALLSAIFAALTPILAKIGIEGVPST